MPAALIGVFIAEGLAEEYVVVSAGEVIELSLGAVAFRPFGGEYGGGGAGIPSKARVNIYIKLFTRT